MKKGIMMGLLVVTLVIAASGSTPLGFREMPSFLTTKVATMVPRPTSM